MTIMSNREVLSWSLCYISFKLWEDGEGNLSGTTSSYDDDRLTSARDNETDFCSRNELCFSACEIVLSAHSR